MGTTIAGNQHIGSNYAQYQYLWKPGSGGDYGTVELYEEDRIFVYQFNPLYDQRDDGVLAVEFYYYYRKPTVIMLKIFTSILFLPGMMKMVKTAEPGVES